VVVTVTSGAFAAGVAGVVASPEEEEADAVGLAGAEVVTGRVTVGRPPGRAVTTGPPEGAGRELATDGAIGVDGSTATLAAADGGFSLGSRPYKARKSLPSIP